MDARSGRRLPRLEIWRRRAADGPDRYGPGAAPAPGPAATASAKTATAAAFAATLGLAAASWVAAARLIHGMDMGVATRLGSFGFFIALWVVMMAAMMLPGAAPAVLRRAQASSVRAVPAFSGSYLAVWALAGGVVYGLYRPHGPATAGVVAIAAGVYEFTPLKQYFRRRCREMAGSGFGLCCAGSSAGLMAMLVAVGVMSIPWVAVITVLVTAQKLLPPKAALDVPLALAITGLEHMGHHRALSGTRARATKADIDAIGGAARPELTK